MIANYHTHTAFCGHASGTVSQYAEAALETGIKTLGFADHIPCEFPDGYVSSYRMAVYQNEQYINEILAVKEEFEGKLEILIGYEAEYFPKLFDKTIKSIKRFPCDYLLLGQHYTNNEYDGTYVAFPTDDKSVFKSYTDQVIKGIETGKFSCVVHPDLLNYTGDASFYKEEALRLCTAAKKNLVPLELNLLGLRLARNYPREDFWSVAGEVGAQTVIGIDAHSPAAFDTDIINKGAEYLARFGIKPLEKLELKKP